MGIKEVMGRVNETGYLLNELLKIEPYCNDPYWQQILEMIRTVETMYVNLGIMAREANH